LGPGAGVHAANSLAGGTLPEIMLSLKSLTAQYLRGELTIPMPKGTHHPHEEEGKWLK